jgi:heme oxygenase
MPALPNRELLRQLKEGTHALHLEAEHRVHILEPAATRDTYRHYLRKMFGFHAPLEEALAANAALQAAGFASEQRRKAPLLVQDLRALGEPGGPSGWPRCTRLPDVATVPRALGCAYVLEGSTLGGQYLLRHLGSGLAALRGEATAFLECYGPRTGGMWKDFAAVLGQGVQTPMEEQEAVEAARDTFACMAAWLDQG